MAKTIITVKTFTYVVYTDNGCTVTDTETGRELATAVPGVPNYFTAMGGSVTLSDDEATMLKPVFNCAPAALGLIGGGMAINAGKYANCATVAEMKAVDSRYGFDLTSDKGWIYPLPRLTNGHGLLCRIFNTVSESIRYIRFNAPVCTNLHSAFAHQLRVESFAGYVPKVEDCSYLFYADYLTSFKRVNATFPSLREATGMFSKCILNKASVLRVASSLPKWTSGTHNITFGIHVDHKYDPDVNAALKRLDAKYQPLNLPLDETTGEYVEIAENKGWNLSVQWNGTATENAYPPPMAAYSRRTRTEPIYAKLSVIEMPDGNVKKNLDWGHYVTDWEANGYQEFASEEQAAEELGLTPYKTIEEL